VFDQICDDQHFLLELIKFKKKIMLLFLLYRMDTLIHN